VDRMLAKLFVRYPEFTSNVILIITSNHLPSPKIRASSIVCEMQVR
jgi:hypothetical protein